MRTESELRALAERVVQSTLSTLPRRPLVISAHQAAEELYNAVDRYMEAVSANQLTAAKNAAERLAVEAMPSFGHHAAHRRFRASVGGV